MVRVRRWWWMAAMLSASACGGTIERQTAAGSAGSPSSPTGGSGGSGGSACVACTPETGGGGEGGSDTSLCHAAFQPPAVACDSSCLVQLTKGGSPTILYQRPSDTAYQLRELLAVTDGYAIALAFWGTMGSTYPGTKWGVVEVPLAGGAPVLVDTFDSVLGVDYYATAILGGDGYLYYDAEPDLDVAGAPTEETLRRVSTTQLGAPSEVLGTSPKSASYPSFAVDDGYLYLAASWGIGRLPKSGGPLETLFQKEPDYYDFPGAIAVGDGHLYYLSADGCPTSLVQRTPASGGTAETIGCDGSRVAFGGSPASLFVASASTVRRFDAGDASAKTVLTAAGAQFTAMTFSGTRLYAVAECPATVPDGPSGGSFVRWYDTVTGATGRLEDDPDYPFVPGPTGVMHDATGATLYYLY